MIGERASYSVYLVCAAILAGSIYQVFRLSTYFQLSNFSYDNAQNFSNFRGYHSYKNHSLEEFYRCYGKNISVNWYRSILFKNGNVSVETWINNLEMNNKKCQWNQSQANFLGTKLASSNLSIIFVGDSLMRNFANSFLGLMRNSPGYQMQPLTLINGRTKNYYNSAPKNLISPSFTGWFDKSVEVIPGLRASMIWRPWYPELEILGNHEDFSGCLKEMELSNCIKNFNYTKLHIQNNYLNSWLYRGALSLKSEIDNLKKKSTSKLIFVFTYPALTSNLERGRSWMKENFTRILEENSKNAIFISHLPLKHVQGSIAQAIKNDLPSVYFGLNTTTPAQLWYDHLHIWGPTQILGVKVMLSQIEKML